MNMQEIKEEMLFSIDYEIKFPEIARVLNDYELGFRDGMEEGISLIKRLEEAKKSKLIK